MGRDPTTPMNTRTPNSLPFWSRLTRSRFGHGISLLLAASIVSTVSPVAASSHSDAPLIKQDPQVNLTDVYTFIRERSSGEKVLVVEVSVRPFSEPGDGVIYDRFSDLALYSIHIADPVRGTTLQKYDFRFSAVSPLSGSGLKNANTILSYGLGKEVGAIQTTGDARQNYTQTYTVTRNARLIGRDFKVAPPNVGLNTTPAYNDATTGMAVSGATSRETLDAYTRQTTYDMAGGITVFAGPREDGFYADTPGIFDLLDSRILDNNGSLADGLGQDGNGVDGFKGFNVLHFGIEIPVSQLPKIKYTGALQPEGEGVGVYASVSRPSVQLLPGAVVSIRKNPYVQVNRLANPIFNEVLVAMAGKDLYNRSAPTSDAALFAKYALTPEVAFLINTVYGTSFATTNRVDLRAVYIPDVIRVNTTTGPVRVAGEMGFHRLSFIGGDTVADGKGNMIPSGWPNGRRFGDDVVDIALTAVASGPAFSTITVVGDNVPANDQVYNRTFPYAATPHSGTRNSKDSRSIAK